VTRCSKCGKEVDAGQNFCPYCAEPLTADGREQLEQAARSAGAMQPSGQERERFLRDSDLEPPSVVPLSSFEERRGETEKSQRKLFIVVGAASAVVLAGLVLLFSTAAGESLMQRLTGAPPADRLEGAARAGTPEFDQNVQKIFVDFNADDDATTAARPIGDTVISMKPTIRNFTNRTINGLELRAAGYDASGQVVKGRNFVIIPGRQNELEPNKTMSPSLVLEGIKQGEMPASLRVEVTAFRFK
jgi:hypothetical protein